MSVTPDSPRSAPRRRVVLLCPGIGHVQRGAESSVAGIYDHLQGALSADWHLIVGAGPRVGNRRSVPIIRRERVPSFVSRRRAASDYEIEQLSFFASCVPLLTRLRPDVLYCRDAYLTRLLALWKLTVRPRTRLIYGNGTPTTAPFPRSFDVVQHLSRDRRAAAIAAQQPVHKQRYLPNAFDISASLTPPSETELSALRRSIGLPVSGRVLICVAAINRYHKRIDHLIRELADPALQDVTLLLLGEHEPETSAILAEGGATLGGRLMVRRVSGEAMPQFYRAADAFVLPSCNEAFGRAIVEAMSYGLPTLVHDSAPLREVVGAHGQLVDMARPGALAAALRGPALWQREEPTMLARHAWVREQFSWERLLPGYLEMFDRCLG